MKIRIIQPIACPDGEVVASQFLELPGASPMDQTGVTGNLLSLVEVVKRLQDGELIEVDLKAVQCRGPAQLCAEAWADDGWTIDEIFDKPKAVRCDDQTYEVLVNCQACLGDRVRDESATDEEQQTYAMVKRLIKKQEALRSKNKPKPRQSKQNRPSLATEKEVP